MTAIPSAQNTIHIESTEVGAAVSEATLTRIGGAINYMNDNAIFSIPAVEQVGDIITSMLTLGQFQAKRDSTWVLMNGQDVTASDYDVLTGNSTVPDMRGRFPRMQDNGAGVDPDTTALGANQAEEIKSHNHRSAKSTTNSSTNSLIIADTWYLDTSAQTSGFTTDYQNLDGGGNEIIESTGGNETRPVATALNFFIKIND